jgi:hypothetical protein
LVAKYSAEKVENETFSSVMQTLTFLSFAKIAMQTLIFQTFQSAGLDGGSFESRWLNIGHPTHTRQVNNLGKLNRFVAVFISTNPQRPLKLSSV